MGYLSECDIDSIVAEVIHGVLASSQLTEMGKVNLHPEGRELKFPAPRYSVIVNNGGHNPPHNLTLDKEGKEYCCCYEDNNGNSFRHTFAGNPVDACYEMVVKLHEQNLL